MFNKESDRFMSFCNEYEQYDSNIHYKYDSEYCLPVSNVDSEIVSETVSEENNLFNNFKIFNMTLSNDDLIIIGVVLFLFIENSIDITILIALGLLFFSNH